MRFLVTGSWRRPLMQKRSGAQQPIRDSPEVFHEHQVVDGGVQPGKENRAAVRRGGEEDGNVAEARSDGRGPSGREIEKLQPCSARGLLEVVNAGFEHCEGRRDYSFQQLNWLPAGSRDLPQSIRVTRKLCLVDVGSVDRLDAPEPTVECHLNGIAATCRGFPDLILARSIRAEVDPLPVAGKAGDVVVGLMGGNAARLATRSGHHIDVGLPFEAGVECNQAAVGRPSRGGCDGRARRGELDGVRSV